MNAQQYLDACKPDVEALRNRLKQRLVGETIDTRAKLLAGCVFAEDFPISKFPPEYISGLHQYTYVLMYELITELNAEESKTKHN